MIIKIGNVINKSAVVGIALATTFSLENCSLFSDEKICSDIDRTTSDQTLANEDSDTSNADVIGKGDECKDTD